MSEHNTILVTGGAGYIGSHAVVELTQSGYKVIVLDNLCNSKRSVLDRVERITGHKPSFVDADIRDRTALREIFRQHRISAVMHFAGLKAVGESILMPLNYYDNNVSGTIALAECMLEAGVRNIVFSSSATVYGDPATVPITEAFPLSATNPYGRTKLMVEEVLRDAARAEPEMRVGLLRYFNPVGAHASGIIGEDPAGTPNNLVPYMSQVAIGQLKELSVFGSDYPTEDGTGVRDYLHVMDLARGHIAALDYLEENRGVLTVNLGTGRGHSVFEMIRAYSAASGKVIPYRVVPRRPGDVAACYADPSFAKRTLGWNAKLGIDAMCKDSWRWQCWAAANLNREGHAHAEDEVQGAPPHSLARLAGRNKSR
jgi:UDP-glucose 4-epimerase